MEHFKKILLLTDFSEISENAVEYAILIAKKAGMEVEIIHIINSPIDWVKLPLEKEKLYPEIKAEIAEAKNKIHLLLTKFKENGISGNQSIIYNEGVENIPRYIHSESVSMIIMGSHNAKGNKAFNLGSNVQKVLRKAKVPVLVVKNKPWKQQLTSIVFASTFEQDQVEPFHSICSFSELLSLELHLLYINTPYSFKETKTIEAMLASFNENCENTSLKTHIYNALNEERGIKQFMEDKQIDILSIATEGKSGLSRWFSPSLTEGIVAHLDIPVLSIHK